MTGCYFYTHFSEGNENIIASIRKRGKSYQITVSNGRDIHDKQILETATWTLNQNKTEKQNQKALERFAMDFEDKVKNGKYLDREKLTFREFTDRWLKDYASMQLEPTTTEVYKFLLNTHIIPEIGHLKLSKVQPAHLNKLYPALLKQRKDRKPGGYSPTTVKRVHAVISSIMPAAVQWNIVTENIATTKLIQWKTAEMRGNKPFHAFLRFYFFAF